MLSAGFMCRAAEVEAKLRKQLRTESGPLDSSFSVPVGHNSCCSRGAAAVSPGRPRQPAAIAEQRDQPMRENTGRQGRSISKITVVYASHLYCTGRTTPRVRGRGHPYPSKGVGVNPYYSKTSLAVMAS